MAKLNQTLVMAIRTMQSARARTLAEIQRTYAREQYADDFKRAEAGRMVEELKATVAAQKAEAAEALAGKIADLDSEEKRLAEARAMDSDYLNRLNLKMENMERLLHKRVAADGSVVMDDLSSTMLDQMKTYFSEFQNDPLAVAILQERLGRQGVAVAPSDNTGKRQKHLKAVQTIFERIVDKACNVIGTHGISEVQDVDEVAKSEEDAFCGYCLAQNEVFSLDDDALIESAGAKDPAMKTGYDGILWMIHIAENSAKNL